MQQKRLIYIILIVLVLAGSAAWGIQQVRGQGQASESLPANPQFIPETAETPLAGAGTIASPATPASEAPPALVAAPTPTEVPPLEQIIPTVAALLDGGETVLAAGDIGTCSQKSDDAVAALAQYNTGPVLLLGDNVYERGSKNEYSNCFDPAWGSFKDRLKPVPGNHEYNTAGASGYYDYFGASAGDPSAGYYSYDIGTWHVIALNSNCDFVDGGCAAGSPQEQWLRADLAAHPAACTLAYWHHPLFSSGDHGNQDYMKPIWDALYAAGAELVLNGHDHDYERFAPQSPDGQADPAGIREIIVGTGGKSLRSLGRLEPNSEVHDSSTYGLLKLTLAPAGYSWEFLPIDGGAFADSGTGICH